jgi:hypothetical protein
VIFRFGEDEAQIKASAACAEARSIWHRTRRSCCRPRRAQLASGHKPSHHQRRPVIGFS